ncbi:hypothetical protein KSY88_09910 [Collinsella aerofaciens]|uniref:hypothetical protein n=1 Tax=Collinsella aerofaciens TaxID=74426 RepID=UPI001C387031|nr:hypothetical protein [Collinsella aerofaciens]MBV4182583.1 hypothetical protein [Collinsella aerofaciens]MBV4194600.1 hypothetical protein [Collinsella aerofaciens]
MDEIVCANTAFRYWRCPPQVRNLYPRLPSPEDGWRALAQAPFVTDILKTPIITTTVPGGVNYHSGLRTTIHCDDASGVDSTLETAMSFRVTNPLATLFTMARFVSPTDLVLAMYEFCGWFSVFEPTAAAEAELLKAEGAAQDATTESLFDLDESQDEPQWKRVYARIKVKEQVNTKGLNGQKKTKEVTRLKGTSLWMRKPLIELHELHEYASKVKKRKWGTKFYNAAQLVTGIAASPLEVAGILLLSLPRSRGGAGFRNVYVNDLTPLTASAQSIAGQKVCYGDIVIVNPTIMKAGIVEIQGEVIHGSGAVLDHDAKRVTALQSMGYDVFLVTHDMLNDAEQLDAIVRSLCSRLELRYRCKTKAQKTKEMELRANVLCNWLEIGR